MNLNQVTITCVDYGESVSFYRALGLRLIVDSPPRYARFECPNGATLSLHAGARGTDATTIYFEVDDVDREVARLEAAGIAIEQRPVEQRWLWYEAHLRDPAGNRVCIFHAGANRRFPPWRVEPAAE